MSFFNKLKNDIDADREKDKKTENKKIEKKQKNSVQKPEKKSNQWMPSEGQLAIDVYQTKSAFVIQAPVAGIQPEDLDITVENDFLILRGEREKTEEIEEKDYFYQECYWGAFSRKVSLPEDVDTSKIKASLKKGILTITVPKNTKKSKKITIEKET